MKCSIIIPVYNNANFTKAALNDLVLLGKTHEIIIVDNASEDHTADVVSKFNGVWYIKNDINKGFSFANNQGFEVAKGEYVLFLNNDIRVKNSFADWTDKLIEQCGDNCIVGTQTGILDGDYNFVKEGQFDPMQKGAYLSGWCMMAKRSVWDKLKIGGRGCWNEDFFLYFEDSDLSWRAKKNGIKLKIVDIPVQHFSRTTGRKYNMFSFFHKSSRVFKKIWKGKLI